VSVSQTPEAALPEPWPDFRGLSRKYGIRPDKRLGQHFLFDPAALDRVIAAAGLTGAETVLEIGAGVGSLTWRLAHRAGRVVAVEIDRRLIAALNEVVAALPQVRVVQGDVLALDLVSLVGDGSYRVVANIPYSITSLLIRKLLEDRTPASRLVLTLQREVAERIVAAAGEMSLLALSVQLYGVPAIVGSIPAGAFYPPPKVDSSILRVDLHERLPLPRESVPALFRLARAGFSQKRKKLRNALAAGMAITPAEAGEWLERAGISPERRAQELGLEDWGRLAQAVGERVRDLK
jgi:16S rRNA (adenine1518-N6/adenine1519-N6)-dimethyltransferase